MNPGNLLRAFLRKIPTKTIAFLGGNECGFSGIFLKLGNFVGGELRKGRKMKRMGFLGRERKEGRRYDMVWGVNRGERKRRQGGLGML